MTKAQAARRILLHGDERFLVEERARTLIEEWRSDLVSDFGQDTIEGQGLTSARLQDAVLQAPFLDPYRIVYVKMAPATRAESLAPALAEIPPTTKLLLTIAGRLSSANKLAKAVTVAGGAVEEMQHLKGGR